MTAVRRSRRASALAAPLVAIAMLVAGCQSAAERAANAMAQGQQLAAAGQYAAAQGQFDLAVQARDDLPDLWMMRARNQIALSDYAGAYGSFRNALDQDRTNREALDALAQLSLASGRLDDARDYAEQILALAADDPSGLLVDASVAFRTGRYDAAAEGVARLLKQSPDNERALVLSSRLEARRGRFGQAIALIEPLFRTIGGGDELRQQLAELYARQAYGAGLLAIARRDAADRPRDAKVMLTLARQLAAAGQTAPALAALDTAHTLTPGDAQRAATVRVLADADVAPAALATALATLPTPQVDMVLAVAEYVLARGDAATADAILPRDDAAVTVADTDLQGARAYAAAMLGRLPEAQRRATAVLALDAGQPYALMAQALVALAQRDGNGALRSARLVVGDNQQFAPGYAMLARVLTARGDRLLADKAFFDASNADKDDPLALRQLATLLASRDRVDDAMNYVRGFTIRNPASIAGWTLRQQLCRKTGDGGCVTRAGAILARLRGGDGAMPATPADERIGERDYRDDDTAAD